MKSNLFVISVFIVIPVHVGSSQADDILLSDDTFQFDSENLIKSIKGAMDTLFEYVGDENGCFYKCPNGAKPMRNLEHIPRANGCGAFGLKLDTTHVPAIERCCNKHDECYDICNKQKTKCDDEFRACLTDLCKNAKKYVSRQLYDGCKSTADMMYAATMALGCKPYKESQKEACLCPPMSSLEL